MSSKEEVLEYVMNTPENTNPAILRSLLNNLPESTKVEANPELEGTEDSLTGIKVDGTAYKVEQPINVVANPELAGTEATLTGLQVGTTKYKAPAEVTANPSLAGSETALTGVQVGSTKYKVNQPTNVVANPTLAGSENDLTGLEVGSTKYKIDSGTTVSANPTLAGTESNLTGLQVGDTKYKVPSGGGSSNNGIINWAMLIERWLKEHGQYSTPAPVWSGIDVYPCIGSVEVNMDAIIDIYFNRLGLTIEGADKFVDVWAFTNLMGPDNESLHIAKYYPNSYYIDTTTHIDNSLRSLAITGLDLQFYYTPEEGASDASGSFYTIVTIDPEDILTYMTVGLSS